MVAQCCLMLAEAYPSLMVSLAKSSEFTKETAAANCTPLKIRQARYGTTTILHISQGEEKGSRRSCIFGENKVSRDQYSTLLPLLF